MKQLQQELRKVLVFIKEQPYRAQCKEIISHKKLKKGAPNNLRPNKFDKNSTSTILKKDVISLSRIYKSLKYQYKTTKAASLSVDIVVGFNCQVREINKNIARNNAK
ncbi:24097_t:CDS:2 [Gigaspora margarita]|uniref:24097_t:CDS:1 n=1 Tax=Gigaspora margarita TaxID=4874 RepID=A0ABM8VY42_GIGMA|nr:24097_t:CDS:2 [Gigaspora margarita]